MLRRAADTLIATPEDLALWDEVRDGHPGRLPLHSALVAPAAA